jgi:hypothetical protein
MVVEEKGKTFGCVELSGVRAYASPGRDAGFKLPAPIPNMEMWLIDWR